MSYTGRAIIWLVLAPEALAEWLFSDDDGDRPCDDLGHNYEPVDDTAEWVIEEDRPAPVDKVPRDHLVERRTEICHYCGDRRDYTTRRFIIPEDFDPFDRPVRESRWAEEAPGPVFHTRP